MTEAPVSIDDPIEDHNLVANHMSGGMMNDDSNALSSSDLNNYDADYEDS